MKNIKKIDLRFFSKVFSFLVIKQMEQATTYQEFAAIRNAKIKNLNQNSNRLSVVNQPKKELISQFQKKELL